MKCFVYGSLRVGDYNADRFGPPGEVRLATAKGALYHVSPYTRVYPVAKFDEEGIIIGEVRDFPAQEWKNIVYMEEGAGYKLWPVVVAYEDGTFEAVVGWHYIRRPLGPLVESGDWLADRDRVWDDEWDEEEDEALDG